MIENIHSYFFMSLIHNARRFFAPLSENKIYTLTVFLEFLSWSMLWVIAIFLIRDVTQVLEFGKFDDFLNVLFRYTLYFSLLMLFSHVIKNYGWVRFLENLRKTLYAYYLPKFIELDNTEVEKQGVGKINHLLQQGSNSHAIMLNDTLYNIAKILPFFIFALYFVFRIYFLLGVAFIFLYIGLTIFTKYFDDKQIAIRRKKHVLKKEVSRSIAKIIMSKYEILQNGKVYGEISRIHNLYDDVVINNKEQNFWGHILFRGSEIILFISKVVLLYFIGSQYFSGDLSLTYVVTFITVILYFEKNAQDFLIFYKNFTRDMHDMTGLWHFFDTTPQISGYEEGNTFEYKKGDIELKNIDYSYDDSKPVFQNLSLKLAGQKVTALVGPSGGGKSTLVKLISGYIKANSGEILIDNQKLSETSLKSYYQNIGYLTQEPSVFDGTVRENLMYGVVSSNLNSPASPHPNPLPKGEGKTHTQKPVASFLPLGENGMRAEDGVYKETESDKILQNIITLANCEFIYDLPNGLDTEIGERGVKLSGGQKQRLAIAKIFLKDPKIIILDEPTSALDSVSEKKITQAMQNLFQDRTVIVIAHRLQTVKHADDILVIENGGVIERGTHSELTQMNGFYKEMLDLQSGF